jgi:hypothetical protein
VTGHSFHNRNSCGFFYRILNRPSKDEASAGGRAKNTRNEDQKDEEKLSELSLGVLVVMAVVF